MAAADAGTIPTVRTQHHWARTHSASEWLKTRDAITWIPSKEIKKKTFKDFKRKVFLMRGKCSRLTAILAHEHVEGQVFFSCLASLSGFLKDAKSVYLKQRLLACVKRRLTLYIRLLFILLLCFVLLFFPGNFYFTWIMNRYSYFVFGIDYLFWSQCFVQKVLYEKVWIHTCTNIQFITRL